MWEAYIALVARRAAGEPLQHITGHQEFYGLDFIVTPDVLIPRPETEFLVERVITLARRSNARNQLLIVDIGTGTGCIAVTVATHIPQARLIATDVSSAALAVARKNARRHNVDSRIEFIEGDMLEPLAARGLEEAVDLLASNPPYVPTKNIDLLQREVRDWEPPVALFGGEEGVDFYRRLLVDARRYVKPGGCLICEIGYGQLDSIRAMIDPAAWALEHVADDLQAIPRTLTIRRRED